MRRVEKRYKPNVELVVWALFCMIAPVMMLYDSLLVKRLCDDGDVCAVQVQSVSKSRGGTFAHVEIDSVEYTAYYCLLSVKKGQTIQVKHSADIDFVVPVNMNKRHYRFKVVCASVFALMGLIVLLWGISGRRVY